MPRFNCVCMCVYIYIYIYIYIHIYTHILCVYITVYVYICSYHFHHSCAKLKAQTGHDIWAPCGHQQLHLLGWTHLPGHLRGKIPNGYENPGKMRIGWNIMKLDHLFLGMIWQWSTLNIGGLPLRKSHDVLGPCAWAPPVAATAPWASICHSAPKTRPQPSNSNWGVADATARPGVQWKMAIASFKLLFTLWY